MASLLYSILILFAFSSLSECRSILKPHNFVLPIYKDTWTDLYVTKIRKGTPSSQISFVVDLNGRFVWAACDRNYVSSTYQAPLCHSTQCHRARGSYCHTCSSKPGPGCHNNTCGLMSKNPVTRQVAMGELAQDVITGRSSPRSWARIPSFLFVCAPSMLLQKALPIDVEGVVGLGPGPISLPTQIASHFGIPSKFALCLGPRGAIFFLGDGPVHMHPGVHISHSLAHTPLMISPQGEYYISIKSIQINNKTVPLNTTLLAIDRNWVGGTKITTTAPYTILQHSIFRPFAESIAKELSNVSPVTPIQPFGVCYSSKSLSRPNVPNIDLLMQNEGAMWRISGANSMVEARPGVLCLAFIDGGLATRAAIEIGAYQMENYFLQFDLAGSKLGFSSSSLFHKASCNNLNFTIG